MNVLKVL
jgi:GcrA cell cycle regulator